MCYLARPHYNSQFRPRTPPCRFCSSRGRSSLGFARFANTRYMPGLLHFHHLGLVLRYQRARMLFAILSR